MGLDHHADIVSALESVRRLRRQLSDATETEVGKLLAELRVVEDIAGTLASEIGEIRARANDIDSKVEAFAADTKKTTEGTNQRINALGNSHTRGDEAIRAELRAAKLAAETADADAKAAFDDLSAGVKMRKFRENAFQFWRAVEPE